MIMVMGLSSKQVSGDGFDWSQGMVKSGGVEISQPAVPVQALRPQQQKQRQQEAAHQQQGPQLRCPRCDSTNTKFCYYNNYSRAQPRHYCKACRRHWTEGGTLRNVPVGGGRKAKRPKTSHPASSAPDPAATGHGNGADDTGIIMPASTQLLPPLSFAQDVLSSALLPPSLSPSACANASYELGSLLSLPSTPQLAGAVAGVLNGAGGYPFSTSAAFPSFLSLTGQEDLAGGIAPDTAITLLSKATPPPWELLLPPPPTCSGRPSGSSGTSTNSGLTELESSTSPSSGYWGSCWEDLTSFLSIDPPAADAPPLHQYFELS